MEKEPMGIAFDGAACAPEAFRGFAMQYLASLEGDPEAVVRAAARSQQAVPA